jgi:hypothetical protein
MQQDAHGVCDGQSKFGKDRFGAGLEVVKADVQSARIANRSSGSASSTFHSGEQYAHQGCHQRFRTHRALCFSRHGLRKMTIQ